MGMDVMPPFLHFGNERSDLGDDIHDVVALKP
jgi:hypothetical protein